MQHRFHVDGGSIPITDGMTLGRSAECDFQLAAQGVSRQHVRLHVAGDAVEIEDLGSSNGTRVNREKIEGRQRLSPGDVVMIGRAELTYGEQPAGRDQDTKRIRARRDPASLVGQLVAGHRIVALLGRGKLGATYEAKQLSLDRKVAFKAFWSDLAAKDPVAADALMAKVQQAAAISDPSIAQLHECGRDEDLLWYTTELVDGDELTELMARDGKVPIELALLVAERTARGLQAAHEQGVIHGNVRPAAIRITRSGNVKVMDLGLDALRRALSGSVASSPAHTAPEISEGEEPAPTTDVYGLGATLFHLLCGRPPYTGTDPGALQAAHRDQPIPVASDLRPGLPSQIDELIHGMLAKRPDWRFGSMSELIGDLTKLREAASRGELAVSDSRPKPSTAAKPATRNRSSESRLRPRPGRARRGPPIVQLVVVVGAVALLIAFLPQIKQLLGQAAAVSTTPSTVEVPSDPPSDPPPVVSDPTPPTEDPAISTPAEDPVTQSTEGDPLRDEWQAVLDEVATAVAAERWLQAERALDRFRQRAARSAGSSLDAAAASRLRTLRLDADRWFQQVVDQLPGSEGPELKQRLNRLDRIRRQVTTANRTSAETLYRQAADLLRRELALARRDARAALEAGELDRLVPIAAALEPVFADTPLAEELERFATAAREAARLGFNADWASTRQGFNQLRGEQALAAAGALLLLGENGAAAGIMLDAKGLDRLAGRRDALLAATSRRLRFDDPGDLATIATRIGEPSLGDHGLTGPVGEPLGIDVDQALARSWQVELVLSLRPHAGGSANATLAVVGGDGPLVAVNLHALASGGEVEASAGDAQGRQLVGSTRDLRIGIACIDGRVSATINGRELLAPTAIDATAGARVQLDVADAEWSLRELRLVGTR